jgi:HK97 family phage major capsid protein
MTLSFPITNVNLNRPRQPSLLRAIRAMRRSDWAGAALERDLSQAAQAIFGYHELNPSAMVLATTPTEYRDVLDAAGVTTHASEALRALGEGTSTFSGATALSIAPQYLTGEFAMPLVGAQVLRQMPEVNVIPVQSNVVEFPRQSAVGQAQTLAENTGATLSDFTPALGEIPIRKSIRLLLSSSELYEDADDPTTNGGSLIGRVGAEVLFQRAVAFELSAWLDQQELEGAGTGSLIKGIRNFSGLTTSSWVATTNGSTPGGDDIAAMLQDIFTANATPTALVMHPRTFFKIARLKDSTGNYIFLGLAAAATTDVVDYSKPRRVGSLWGASLWLTTSVPITDSQGSNNAATHILYGDFSKLWILARQGIELFFSPDYAMNADQWAIRATARETVAASQSAAFSVATGLI